MHLDEKLKSYAEYLDAYPTEFYTCHCTGVSQYEYMKQYMKRVHYLAAGQEIEL